MLSRNLNDNHFKPLNLYNNHVSYLRLYTFLGDHQMVLGEAKGPDFHGILHTFFQYSFCPW